MGTETSSNEKNNSNQNTPQKNLYENLGIPSQKPRRHRLYSDPQDMPQDNEKLQPIRRYSNINSTNLQSHSPNSNNNNSSNNNNMNFKRGYKRKMSDKYCEEFRRNHTGNSDFLAHLVDRLNPENEQKKLDFEQLSLKYIPKYLFDWRLVENSKTGEKFWKNMGKIEIDKNMFLKIKKLGNTHIGASEPFYLKRTWLFSYLMINYGNSGKENPLITIDRKNIFIDSYNKFIHTPELNLTRPLRIKFLNESNKLEESLFREWYKEIFREMTSPQLKLFIPNNRRCLEPNSLLFYPKYPGMNLDYYVFIGKLMIKSILDLMCIKNTKFNRVIAKGISNRPITLDDIKYYDLDLYQQLKLINDTQVGLNPQLAQTRFTYIEKDFNNIIKEYELIPGGRNIYLNDNNKYSFIDKFIQAKVYKPYEEQIRHCQKGLKSIFKTSIEGIFSLEELKFLISGLDYIDFNDWKENTIYKGCYNANHPVIKLFWQKIESMNKLDIYKFLEFVTGSGSIPIDGFGCLKGVGGKIQKFTIEPLTNYSASNPDINEFQPITAKRLYHSIVLPLYQSRQEFDMAMNIILCKKRN